MAVSLDLTTGQALLLLRPPDVTSLPFSGWSVLASTSSILAWSSKPQRLRKCHYAAGRTLQACRSAVWRRAKCHGQGNAGRTSGSSLTGRREPRPRTRTSVAMVAQPSADEESSRLDVPDRVEPSTVPPYLIINLGSLYKQLPVRQVVVWAVAALAVYQLRDFVGIAMGTFVLSVVGDAVASWVEVRLPGKRHFVVAALYLTFIGILVGIGIMYIPSITQEGGEIVRRLHENEDIYSLLSDKMRSLMGDQVTDQVERFLLIATSRQDAVEVLDLSVAGSAARRSSALQELIGEYAGIAVTKLALLITAVSRFAIQCFVSLVFSFMIVWDMPALRQGVQSLRSSRLAVAYNEIAPVFVSFGRLLTKALQAQSLVAIANTVLTAFGMAVLCVRGVGPMSVIVFACSFVPVAGVVMSTVPIGVVALTEGGLFKLMLVILMVILIHAVEAYVLNPAIYSAHLKLHPLVTLATLVFAEHTLGVWGLLTAVPMAVFFNEYIINRKAFTVGEESNSVACSQDVAPATH